MLIITPEKSQPRLAESLAPWDDPDYEPLYIIRPEPLGDHLQDLLLPSAWELQPNLKPISVMFWGRRGRGKTLSMVAIANYQSHVFASLETAFQVKTNIRMDFADYSSEFLIEEIIKSYYDDAYRTLCAFDEITSFVPSRRSMSGMNLDVGTFLGQIRKRLCEPMFTCQFPTEVSRDVLRQVDFFILTEAHIPKYAAFSKALAQKAYVKLYIFDYWGNYNGRMRPTEWPPPIYMADKVLYLFDVNKVWNQYQTSEVVVAHYGKKQEDRFNARRTAEWEASVQEDIAAGRAEGIPSGSIMVDRTPMSDSKPTNLRDWALLKAGLNGQFALSSAHVREVKAIVPTVTSMDDLKVALPYVGVRIERRGHTDYGVL